LLTNRATECARLDRLLEAAEAGRSTVLVLRGEPGIGKTALLVYAAERAAHWRVLRAAGVDSEMELPFAGLHQLCAPLLGRLERLPPPQRDALNTAFGITSGTRPDRFVIGLAVLSLLSDAAADQPLVCLVDDAQWLDRSSAQVLAFVARRLEEESVVLLLAEREPMEPDEFARLPDLRLEGLDDEHAAELLASAINVPLDKPVREQILAETRGNPLALLELPHEFSPVDLAGGYGLPAELPLPRRIEASFLQRVEQLPVETQRLMLLAAAEPTGEPALLWRAASRLGVAPEAADSAEADGLFEVGARIAFRHPLLRSAIYGAASAEDRRNAHGALASATDADLDPDRQAWHRACATLVADEEVAAELERSAGRAQARGGLAAAAAFLERSSAFTPERGLRARRALAAAEAKQLAGAPQAASTLVATAAAGPLDELDGAMLQRLEGQIALDLRRGAAAVPLLLDAAKRLEPLNPNIARETYMDALRAASIAGRLGGGIAGAAEAARKAPPPAGPPRAVDLLLDGLALRFTEGYAASAPSLKRALSAVRDEGRGAVEDVRWPWFGRRVAPDLFDDESWHALATRNVQIAREKGALAVLPLALNYLAQLRIFEGDLDAAAALVDEADAIADATGSDPIAVARGLLAACRGDEKQAASVIEADDRAARARGEGVVLTFGEHARAVLHNGLGHYEAALVSAENAVKQDELGVSVWSLPEVVEAAVRSHRPEVAVVALERLTERTGASGTDFARGVEARARALLSENDVAPDLYEEAIDCLGRCRLSLELARAHLLYGEWLRRERRRVDARKQLRTAHDMFAAMGAEAFAARAARELLGTGEKARKRAADTRDQLTAQETQIAHLARDGFSNPEIAAQLFISPRTVEYHLHKVFGKLGVSRRSQLNRVLSEDSRMGTTTPAN
jgi:DNA-binding NarL/FixJ family response regulator